MNVIRWFIVGCFRLLQIFAALVGFTITIGTVFWPLFATILLRVDYLSASVVYPTVGAWFICAVLVSVGALANE